MRVGVVGAGIIGLSVAWELLRRGHRVTGYDAGPRRGAELVLAETLAGLRPGSPDNAPVLGHLHGNVHVAGGHHRNGVLLAPVTVHAVADLITGGSTDVDISGCGPDRFT